MFDISQNEKNALLDSINQNNALFAKTIMSLCEKYQILNPDDLSILCDRKKSRQLFLCDYAYLKKIDVSKDFSAQIKSADGRNRYYGDKYKLSGDIYVITSQLYGFGSNATHNDSRTPFYNWILKKFGVAIEVNVDDNLKRFKQLLEIFVKQLRINNDILPGEKVYGQGYRDMPKIRNIYKDCREFDGYILELALQAGFHSYDASNYVHLRESWVNIVPIFDELPDGRHDVSGLQVVDKPDNKVKTSYPAKTVTELGLFDGKTPNETLEAFFNDFKTQIDLFLKIGKFDSWEIIDENTAIKTCDKSFFEHNGSGVPKGICWFFDAEDIPSGVSKDVTLIFNGSTYYGKLRNDTTDRRRIQILWNVDLGKNFGNYKVTGVKATFRKIDKNTYEIIMGKEGEKMTTKEKVSAIKNYIASKGFNYEGYLIENFYLSLKSKPFVILAGTSGTGKTRLVKLFAEAINAKMLLVPVRPDWSDSSDLFGHVDLSGEFNPGAILEFIKEAQDNIDKPYFLCLDEMNLARVEYYFSDFLSIIETRENVDGKIVSDSLVDEKYYKKDTAAAENYGKIIIPENLYIIGTVNMDETTFPFSKKVLDRANTIEFSFVDLMAKPSVNSEALPKALNEENSFLKTEYLYLNDVTDDNTVTTTCFELEQLNQILLKANLHVGYRVRDEITFYMSNNKNADNLISETAAFDNQIMQKILPRIQGSSSAIKEVLIEMFQKCAGDYSGLTGSNTYEQMINCIETKECKYPNSARKIAFMVRRFEEDGFTSYWL